MWRGGLSALVAVLVAAPVAHAQVPSGVVTGTAEALTYQDVLGGLDNIGVSDRPDGTLVISELSPFVEAISATGSCTEERNDRFECTPGPEQRLVINPAASDDIVVAIEVTRFSLEILGGPGNDILLGGQLEDTMVGGENADAVAGSAGDDRLDGGQGGDGIDGGPGVDLLLGGEGNDSLFGIDGAPGDRLDCGPGEEDYAFVDRGDRTEGCEIIEVFRPTPAQPEPPFAPAGETYVAKPNRGEPLRAKGLQKVVTFPVHCVGRDGTRLPVRAAAGFVPRRSTLYLDGRRIGRALGRRTSLRLPRGGRVRVVVVGRDGRKLMFTRRVKRC